AMMEKTGTVISGSVALEVTNPGSCTAEDLNFYCPLGATPAAIDSICQQTGFVLDHERESTMLAGRTPFSKLNVNNGVKHVLRFTHQVTKKRITLIESLSPSPLVPILFFHLTILMNYISGREAVAFYPELT
ncbi:hypothetical protein DFP72DRAFT_781038, partial [Ephemerocybe angulata]